MQNCWSLNTKNHLSHFKNWEQRSYVKKWALFEKNIGLYVGLDETALSSGELCTILINKNGKEKRNNYHYVQSVSCWKGFPNVAHTFPSQSFPGSWNHHGHDPDNPCFSLAAKQAFDRLHILKLTFEAAQEMCIKIWWKTLEKEIVEIV